MTRLDHSLLRDVLQEIVAQQPLGVAIDKAEARELLEALGSIERVVQLLQSLAQQRKRANELLARLRQVRGSAGSIALSLMTRPELLARVLSELEAQIEEELERRRRLQLLQDLQAMRASLIVTRGWQAGAARRLRPALMAAMGVASTRWLAMTADAGQVQLARTA